MRRGVLLGILLAMLFRVAGRFIGRRWRYGGDQLPADLVRRSQ